ncbi:MAG: VPLPA-CTERM-specific exosortase XrtD [Gammaproteobacteria bacterium]|nr:VPLPA-CTERM-specific exosortase XrtD [Gammaproteobacteria bacterium]
MNKTYTVNVLALIIGLLLSTALALLVGWSGVVHAVENWSREEYSYGYFVPLLVAFFIWQKKNDLVEVPLQASWSGVVLAAIGLLVIAFGELGTLYVMVEYGFVVTLHGIALALLGWKGYRLVAPPLALLFFVVPLPNFFYNNLSAYLQLVSSQIGVWVVRAFGISVFLEGNVIQLATMKLQVAEACSGLRYLFPLMAVGFIVAYMYRAPLWKRALLFLSTIPITVLMNSMRIGLIGVSVEYWGSEMAEGFLHDFEGWVVFMASLGVLMMEMWLLNHIGRTRQRFRDVFYLELPGPSDTAWTYGSRATAPPFIALVGVLVAGTVAMQVLPHREEVVPSRESFAGFPMAIADWEGRGGMLESIYIDALKFDDYLLADYFHAGAPPINLYIAYYGSQRKGASVHSPKSCLPGGGWEMSSFGQYVVDGVTVNGQPLKVNRSIIQKGENRQLVYYWFQQRGRVMTNEYIVKLNLFRDAIVRNRTDGALVRLVLPMPQTLDVADADRELSTFARVLAPLLTSYIPN